MEKLSKSSYKQCVQDDINFTTYSQILLSSEESSEKEIKKIMVTAIQGIAF